VPPEADGTLPASLGTLGLERPSVGVGRFVPTSVIITTRPSINEELMKRFASEIMPAFRPGPG
jgi:hypothetical protein